MADSWKAYSSCGEDMIETHDEEEIIIARLEHEKKAILSWMFEVDKVMRRAGKIVKYYEANPPEKDSIDERTFEHHLQRVQACRNEIDRQQKAIDEIDGNIECKRHGAAILAKKEIESNAGRPVQES